jgi:adenine phosphoribosyltransferase
MAGRRIQSGGAHLIDQRLEARLQVPHLYGIAALAQIAFGAQQQPGTGGVEPVDPCQIEGNPLATGHLDSTQAPVDLGGGRHQPLTGRCEDQRSRLFGFNECTGDGRHEVQELRVRLSAAERGLSNYKKSGYPATTSVSIAATGLSRTTRMDLKQHIRSIPDFPKPGILFYDISTLLAHPEAWQTTVLRLAEALRPHEPDLLVGIESRGFLVAAPLAYQLGRGFAMIRKQGKLPGRTARFTYDLEYGTDTIEIQEDAITPGQRVAVLDDLLATGGTMQAAINLVRQRGGEVTAAACIIELSFLKGRSHIDVPFTSMIAYDS